MKEQIQNIGSAIDFVSIAEPKFRTNTIEMIFMLPAGKQNNSAYALLEALLTSTCAAHPSITAMSRKLSSMYGATLKGSTIKRGDVLQLSLTASVIANRYALEGEDLLSELTELLLGCLFAPNAADGAFSETDFRIEKQDLLDAIEAEINDKRAYATDRAVAAAFEGEPFAYPLDGTAEDVELLTPASVYESYQKMLREAVIRIYHVGPEAAPKLAGRLQTAFEGVERCPVELTYRTPSPCKAEPVRVTEPMAVTQSKLVIVLKGQTPKKYAMNLMNLMFGGSPFSMLFNNVREKMSLCYYCSSRYVASKQAVFVSSGVELENAEKAHEAILAQLDAIRRGEFEDEMLENAKRSAVNSLHGIGDTPFSCIGWSHGRYCEEEEMSIEEIVAAYQGMTRQDMIDAANALREDTVYLMQQEVEHE